MMSRGYGDLVGVNTLDRLLSFFANMRSVARVGETWYQGDDMPHFFFVDSGIGSDGNDGSDPRSPIATLNEAFDRCSANRGDIIFLAPGHAETLTDDLNLDVAGVTVIGLGAGAARPTFTVGNATGEAVNLTAASIHLENIIFITGIDALDAIIEVAATDCVIKDCEFREATSIQWVSAIDVTPAVANTADRTRILGCKFVSNAVGASQAIELGEVNDRVEIRGCEVWGDYANAAIHNPTGKVLTNLLVADCFLENKQTGDHAIELVSACTGALIRNLYKTDMTQQTGADPGSCFSFECYQTDVIDTNGILAPVVT